MGELILATRNAHKIREFAGLLPGWTLLSLPDDVALPPESGSSFAENALDKARAAAAALGRPAIADDSGIAAPALGGAPGIFSARYAGERATDGENLAKLIDELTRLDDRRVEYICSIAYVEPGGVEHVFTGRCGGTLTAETRGDGGFGYDPAVIPEDFGDGRTMAELSQVEKDAISHRGRAARELLAWLSERDDAERDVAGTRTPPAGGTA